MLLANNLQFKRQGLTIFENINVAANPGKIILIKGNNGSGKTTLLKTLLNILEPAEGDVFWFGKNIKTDIFKFYINTCYIMDKPTSNRDMSILENIYFWKKFSKSTISDQEIIRILNVLNLQNYAKQKIKFLSLGEIKKLELSRIIIEQKKLWILDEPFSNLDSNSIDIISKTFIDHSKNGGSVIFASHYNPNIHNEIISLDK